MTKHSRFLLVFIVLLFAGILSACAGTPVAESWPGVTLDASGQNAYISYSTNIFKVNLSNGTEAWRFPAEPNNRTHFYAPLQVADNGDLLVGGYDHVFYSIKDGGQQTNWTFTGAKDRFVGQAAIMGDLVLAPSADNHLYALNLQDGAQRWSFSAGHALWATPIAAGDMIYQASMDHHVYALNVQSGEVVWDSKDLGGQIVAAPAMSADGSVLYTTIFGSKVDDPQRSSQLIALDAKTGQVRWKTPVTGWVWATPLLDQDKLYFGDTAGYFYAVDAQQGKPLWKYPQSGAPKAKSGILAAAAIAGDKIYFGNESGVVTALNLADGTLLWEKSPFDQGKAAQIYAGLKIANDLLLIAPTNYENAILMALDLDGNLKWQFLPAKK